ncbi:MAG: SH3 domain-containing protein, partial [Clostridiales bacterium]|nr:SH3 domain-containing protein [Clostridiales bacterium]
GAGTNYSVIGYLYNGNTVTITGESGNWYAISYNGTTGYVAKEYIQVSGDTSTTPSTPETPSTGGETNVSNQKGKVINVSSNLRVRKEPNTSSEVLGYLLCGDIVEITGKTSDWYKINFRGQVGYVSDEYIQIVDSSIEGTKPSTGNTYSIILNAMKAHLGTPYVWGGSGEYLTTALLNKLSGIYPTQAANGAYTRARAYADKGYRAFDCSGLMQWGFAQAGVRIGRSTWDQILNGVEVPISQVQPGDLLFYSNLNHVGMYIGNGQWIEAPNKNADVRIVSVPWNLVTRARRVLN